MSESMTAVAERVFAGLSQAEIALLQARAARYARSVEEGREQVADAVVFARGEARYAVPLESLREIRPLRQLCKIPGAARHVPGVFHYRGEIVSVHDVEAFLGGAMSPVAAWVLIVEHEQERIGLMADEVIGVEPAPPSAISPVPVTMGEAAACFQGLLGRESLLLSPARLFSTPAFHSAFLWCLEEQR